MPTDVPDGQPFVELEITLDSLQLVGRGRTADVCAWEDGQVLKLFHPRFSEEPVRREALATRLAHEAGLAVPAVGGLVRVADRLGVIYERISGGTMLGAMRGNLPRVAPLSRQMGALHAAMHGVKGGGLMLLSDYVEWNIAHAPGITEDLRAALLARLDTMPPGDALCHGDLHPDNIVMTARGPVIIDWMTAVCGNPLADIARSLLMIRSGAPLEQMGRLETAAINLARLVMFRNYMRAYRQVRAAPEAELAAWRPIMAAARLTEGVPESEKVWLRRMAAGEA